MKVGIYDLWQRADGTKTPKWGKGDRWQTRHYVLDADGVRHMSSKNFSKKVDAEAYRTATEHAVRSGSYVPEKYAQMTFRELSESAMNAKKSARPSTLAINRRDLDGWILPKWASRPISSITRLEFEQWVTELEKGDAPHKYHGRSENRTAAPLAPSSIRRLKGVFSECFAYATDHGWSTTNPSRRVQLPKVVAGKQIFLDYEQIEALADSAFEIHERQSDRALVMLLAYTGLRIGEALALRKSDLNFETHRLLVERTWTGNTTLSLGPTKSGKSRSVPLHGFLENELRPLIDDQPENAWLFRAPRGDHHSPDNWRNRTWYPMLKGTELEGKLSPHDLRHTAASAAISAGADVKLIQLMLGHADASMTLNVYGHLWPDKLDEVTQAVGKARNAALSHEKGV